MVLFQRKNANVVLQMTAESNEADAYNSKSINEANMRIFMALTMLELESIESRTR